MKITTVNDLDLLVYLDECGTNLQSIIGSTRNSPYQAFVD